MCRLQIVSSRSEGITALVLAVLLMAAPRVWAEVSGRPAGVVSHIKVPTDATTTV